MLKNSSEASYFAHGSAYIDSGATIGENTKIWHFSHIQSGARIGKNCTFGQNVNVGNKVIVGDNCKIQNNVSLYDGVTLENEVFCGPSCVFTNDLTPRACSGNEWRILPTLVKRGASIGANATIVCGNTIGNYAMVGSGAVVVDNVANHALVVGTPARQIGWVCQCGTRLTEDLYCASCESHYVKTEDSIRIATDSF